MTNRTSPACFVTWSVAIARALAQRTTPPPPPTFPLL